MNHSFEPSAVGRYIIDIDGCLRATNAMLVKAEDIIALHGRLAHDAVLVREVNGETIPLSRRERIELSEDSVTFFRSCAGPRLFRSCVSPARGNGFVHALAA